MGNNPDDDVIIRREKGGNNKPKKNKSKSTGEKKSALKEPAASFSPQLQKQIRIISILLFVLSIFVILALVSYTPKDEVNTELSIGEVHSVFTGDDAIKAKADKTSNWLGITGAIIAEFLYNSTIGYAIFFLPLILIVWAKDLFRNYSIGNNVLKISSWLILFTIAFSACCGALHNILWIGPLPKEWFGAVGLFLSETTGFLLGSAGSFLLFFIALSLISVKLFNIDVDKLFDRTQNIAKKSWAAGKSASHSVKQALADTTQEIQQKRAEMKEQKKEAVPAPETEQPEEIPEKEEIIQEETEEPARIIKSNFNIKVNNPAVKNSSMRNEFRDEYGKEKPVNKIKNNIYDDFKDEFEANKKQKTETENLSAVNEEIEPITNNKQPEIREIREINEQPIEPDDYAVKNETIPQYDVIEDTTIFETEEENIQPEQEIENQVQERVIPEITMSPSLPLAPLGTIYHDSINLQEGSKKPLVVTVKEDHIERQEEEVIEDMNPLSTSIHDEDISFISPPVNILIDEESTTEINEEELKLNARLLQEKLETFKIFIENLTVTPGPVVTQYEFVPAPGIKISKIEGLVDDIAMALKARGIRIIAPVPGKGTVGIEIPNRTPSIVRFSSLVKSKTFQEERFKLPIALGKTISGDVYCMDLCKMPHLLIAGSTGAGKSVGINTVISSLLYKKHPKELKFVIIDPKKVELQQYGRLSNHFIAASPDVNSLIITAPEEAVIVLKSLCAEMDQRYDILASVGQRNIADYNKKVKKGKLKDDPDMVHREMPYIVCVIDELADLMLTASKEVEQPIIRLAQLARAIGIHLVVATQRPSVNVITGIIKANFPARISYLVASKVDSRTILDIGGAEQLLGHG